MANFVANKKQSKKEMTLEEKNMKNLLAGEEIAEYAMELLEVFTHDNLETLISHGYDVQLVENETVNNINYAIQLLNKDGEPMEEKAEQVRWVNGEKNTVDSSVVPFASYSKEKEFIFVRFNPCDAKSQSYITSMLAKVFKANLALTMGKNSVELEYKKCFPTVANYSSRRVLKRAQ